MAESSRRNAVAGKRRKSHVLQCLYQRQLGFRSSWKDDLLKSFVEEKASLPNQNQPCEVSGQTRSTLLMEFSPDGKRIASTHGDHSIRVTDIRTGKCTHTLTGHPRTPWCIAFHPSNNHILGSGCLGGEVRIWDLQGGGSEVWHSDDALSIASMTFHPSDNVVVFAISNKLHFWDWTRAAPFAVCETAHDFEKIRWVKFDCVGNRLLTAIANASDETLGDGSPFSLFSERSLDGSRYSNNGSIDGSQVQDNSVFYQMHRMSTNDDSLMDLRTAWDGNNGNRNAVESRGLSIARRYAYDVTNQAYRSSLDSRSMFASDTQNSALVTRESSSHQNAANGIEPGSINLSTRTVPLLSSTAPPSSLFSSTDWLSAPQERELEAGDALLTLAADGRQTPSRYVHSLSANSTQRRFRTGDDPLSANLTLLEPGYVEVMPSTDPYNNPSEGAITSTPTMARAEELSGSVILNQLLQQEDTESHEQRESDFDPGVHPLSSVPLSEIGEVIDFTGESQMESQPNSSGSDLNSIDRIADIWLESSTNNWEIEQSSSLTANQLSTDAGSLDLATSVGRSTDSGLDLRLRAHGSQENNNNPREHSYAMPALSRFDLSSTSEEIDLSSQSEYSSFNLSCDSRNDDTPNCPPLTTDIPGAADGQCLNLTSLQSLSCRAVSEPFTFSGAPRSAERRTRAAERRSDEPLDSSSARCRMFSFADHRGGFASSSAATGASATASSTGAAASSSLSNRAHRQNEARRLRHNRASNYMHSLTHTNDHFADSGMPAVSCAVCSDTSIAQIFNSDERRPSSSHTHGRTSTGTHQLTRSSTSRDERSTVSGFLQLMEPVSSTSDSQLSIGESSRYVDSFHHNLSSSFGSDTVHRRPSASGYSSSTRPRLLHLSGSNSSLDASVRQSRVIPRIEIFPDELDDRAQSADEHTSQIQQGLNDGMRYLEPGIYRPAHLSGSRFTSISDRLRERQERINFHVEELRSRFGLGSSSAAASNRFNGGGNEGSNTESLRRTGPLDDDVFSYPTGSPGFSSGADAAGVSLGNEDRTRIVNRLRGFREEIQAMRLEMLRNTQRDQDRMPRGYRYYMPLRQLRNSRESFLSGETDGIRMHAAFNRAISGALVASGESSVGSNVVDLTYRIQAWDFIKCQIPDLTDSEFNVLVRHAKIHNDANVDISQDGSFLCTFVQPSRSFAGDIILSVYSLMPENFGECLFTKSFGPNAISISISPCNHYVLVGLATKRFTWMFTPKQMVAQVYQLKTPRAEEDSMEHVCDITHPCDMDFRAPISMNSARWLLGPGEGLAYGTNRGDLNIYRPGFDQIEKPEVNDSDGLSETNPIRRNLMQMLGLTVPRMMSTATQTSLNLRRSASTQTDQNSQSSSSSSSSSSPGAANVGPSC